MRLLALCVLLALLSSHALGKNPPQVPDAKSRRSNEASDSKGVSPVTVINNCNSATQAEQKANSGPDRGWPVWGNIPDAVLAFVGTLTLLAVWRQSVETGRSAKAAEESARAARNGIILAYRPRLTIRGIQLADLGSILTNDKPTKIKYVVANNGGTEATVTQSNVTANRFEGQLPEIPPYSDERSTLGTFALGAGEYQERTFEMDSAEGIVFRVNESLMQDGVRMTKHFYFFGFIEYRDSLSIPRRTAFCRRYDMETKRFVATDDPEYEYSD